MEHEFTAVIRGVLADVFGGDKQAAAMLKASPLLQYLNLKTKSASRGSKSRGSFANLYAIYVLVEDYVVQGFHESEGYADYDGAKFSELFKRQRELPFGSKLQNHALNHRLNQEFKKYFPAINQIPILRDTATNRYWINEQLLQLEGGGDTKNLACAVLRVIDAYIEAKQGAFKSFIEDCANMQALSDQDPAAVIEFVGNLLRPTVDARVFEIVSFSILKVDYSGRSIYWGWTLEELHEEFLELFKTGRTNANDGGIDFVMRPLGRFFQATETLDMGKYFLDIDKVQKYPITFVIKTEAPREEILSRIREHATEQYGVRKIVERYMSCIEGIINVPELLERLGRISDDGAIAQVIAEIVQHSRVEFDDHTTS